MELKTRFESSVVVDQFLGVKIVIPTLNEEKNLEFLLDELFSLGYSDIVIIDGNSTDRTVQVAEKYGVKVIIQHGSGKGNAIRQALNEIIMDFGVLLLMDADGSMDPREIPFFIRAIESGADLVKGSRFLDGGYTYDMSILRRIGNHIFISLVNLLCSTGYSDLCYGFLAFNKKSKDILSQLVVSDRFEIETEILIKAKKIGLNVVEVPSIEFNRKNGRSKLETFGDGLRIFQRIFQESIS